MGEPRFGDAGHDSQTGPAQRKNKACTTRETYGNDKDGEPVCPQLAPLSVTSPKTALSSRPHAATVWSCSLSEKGVATSRLSSYQMTALIPSACLLLVPLIARRCPSSPMSLVLSKSFIRRNPHHE